MSNCILKEQFMYKYITIYVHNLSNNKRDKAMYLFPHYNLNYLQ